MAKKQSGRNLQKKSSLDCSHYRRVKKDAKTRQNRVLRRKLNTSVSFDD